MNYAHLIDAETWAFIKETERFYPVETIDYSVEQQRQVYDQMCRAFFQGYPEGVTVAEWRMGAIPTRIYTKSDAQITVVYFHGGGFVVGGLESHDDVCAEICDQTGFRVIAVDYRLAPEFKHPAMFDDAKAATLQVLTSFEGSILLCGDSAGGNLVAGVSHAMRGVTDRILGQVLIYPSLGGDMAQGSYLAHADAPLLRLDEVAFYSKIRVDGVEPTQDPTFAALQDTDFSGLPATVIISAECDPLCDDGRDYRDAIQAAGGRAIWIKEPGLVHGFLRARTTVRRAQESFERVVTALSGLGRGEWPLRLATKASLR